MGLEPGSCMAWPGFVSWWSHLILGLLPGPLSIMAWDHSSGSNTSSWVWVMDAWPGTTEEVCKVLSLGHASVWLRTSSGECTTTTLDQDHPESRSEALDIMNVVVCCGSKRGHDVCQPLSSSELGNAVVWSAKSSIARQDYYEPFPVGVPPWTPAHNTLRDGSCCHVTHKVQSLLGKVAHVWG